MQFKGVSPAPSLNAGACFDCSLRFHVISFVECGTSGPRPSVLTVTLGKAGAVISLIVPVVNHVTHVPKAACVPMMLGCLCCSCDDSDARYMNGSTLAAREGWFLRGSQSGNARL